MKISEDTVLKLKNFFTADKKRSLAVLAAAVGIILILLSFTGKGTDGVSDTDVLSAVELEESLCELLSSIEGVRRCRVAITLASGERLEYKNGSVVYGEPARVSGAVVVCEGADDPKVVREINDAVSALFDIGTNRISVQKMK
jgi:stage III sporulation protein AG